MEKSEKKRKHTNTMNRINYHTRPVSLVPNHPNPVVNSLHKPPSPKAWWIALLVVVALIVGVAMSEGKPQLQTPTNDHEYNT